MLQTSAINQRTQTQSLKQTYALIKSDMQFRCDYEHKEFTLIRTLIFLSNQTVMSQVLYRLQMFFYLNQLWRVASVIEGLNSLIYTVRIDCNTQIGAGFLLLHANYINIGKNVTIGKNCIMAHQNSIMAAFKADRWLDESDQGPTVGDHVLLGAGSSLYGAIEIGSYSKISANSAVDKSHPAYSVLFGVPARNFRLV